MADRGSADDERRGEVIGSALAAAIFGILLGPVIGGIATVTGPGGRFHRRRRDRRGLVVWVSERRGAPARPVPSPREVFSRMFTGPVMLAFWFVVLPSVLAGTFDVLVPLRLDALGASGIGVGVAFFTAAAIEAFTAPVIGRFSDRRGRMTPIRAGLIASPIAALCLALPGNVVLLGVALVGGRARDEPDLDPGDGAALRQRRGRRPRPRVRDRPGQPRLGGRAGARRVGGRGVRRRDPDAAAYALVAAAFAITFAGSPECGRLRRAPVPAAATILLAD